MAARLPLDQRQAATLERIVGEAHRFALAEARGHADLAGADPEVVAWEAGWTLLRLGAQAHAAGAPFAPRPALEEEARASDDLVKRIEQAVKRALDEMPDSEPIPLAEGTPAGQALSVGALDDCEGDEIIAWDTLAGGPPASTLCGCGRPADGAFTCEYHRNGKWEPSANVDARPLCFRCAAAFQGPSDLGQHFDAWRMTFRSLRT